MFPKMFSPWYPTVRWTQHAWTLFWTGSLINQTNINRVRMFLHVITISDISEYHGQTILPHLFYGQSTITSNLTWPASQRPPDADWQIWWWALKKFLLNKRGSLLIPLGRWTTHKTHVIHRWTWSKTTQCIYLWDDNQWLQRHALSYIGTSYEINPLVCSCLPADCLPVEVVRGRSHLALLHKPCIVDCHVPISVSQSLISQEISKLPTHIQSILGILSLPKDDGE